MVILNFGFAQETAFTYQESLADGASAANGSYDFRFTLFDSTNLPGTIVAGPVTNSAITVSKGLFTVTLDFGASVFDGEVGGWKSEHERTLEAQAASAP